MNIFSGMKMRMLCSMLFLLSALVACQKKSINFGEVYTQSFTNIIEIDTLTPALSVYKLDTFATSGTGTVMVGKFADPAFGTTTISSYQQIGLPLSVPTISLQAVFDSLTLILTPTKDYYGDTTVPQQIAVHQVTQDMMYAPEKFQFYNTTSFSYNPTPLGSKSFKFSPNTSLSDSVEIRLSDATGQDFFNKLRSKDDKLTMQANFLQYFKGIALVPSSSSTMIQNFKFTDSTFKLRIYYHEPTGASNYDDYIQFPAGNAGIQFNHIDINRNVAPLNSLPAGFPVVPSSALGAKAYMQYATGLYAKLSFPTLQNLLNIDTAGKILKANLIIRPVRGTYDKTIYRLPPTITLGTVDKTNAFIGNGQGSFLSGALFYDDLTGDNTSYTIDVTNLIQQQLRINYEIRNSLLIYTPSNTQFYRMVIGDKTTGKYGIELQVFYVVVNNP